MRADRVQFSALRHDEMPCSATCRQSGEGEQPEAAAELSADWSRIDETHRLDL
jgi:hypothetical protein